MEPAPYYADVADGPPDGHAVWRQTSDGVRVRVGLWPGPDKGTVLLFSGRTGYIEKYGPTAVELAEHGYATATIDWRGQGLADRMLADPATGHVGHFSDYQRDVQQLVACANEAGMPRPFYLVAHSMGGCIGLRAVMEGLDVKAAAFTSPMWGIAMSPLMRPVAWLASWASRFVGLGHRYAPGTSAVNYVNQAPFDGNELTTDPDLYAFLAHQISAHPDLNLGGPSLRWLYEALKETSVLARKPVPDLPALTLLGTNERIVDPAPIHVQMNAWRGGQLEIFEGAEHEILLERADIRVPAIHQIATHFEANG